MTQTVTLMDCVSDNIYEAAGERGTERQRGGERERSGGRKDGSEETERAGRGGGQGGEGDIDISFQSVTHFLIHEWRPEPAALYESWS